MYELNPTPKITLLPVSVAGSGVGVGFSLKVTKRAHHDSIRKSMKGVNRERKFVKSNERKVKMMLAKFFREQRGLISKDLVGILTKSQSELIERVLATMNLTDWTSGLPRRMKPYISAVAVDGGETTAEAMGIMTEEVLEVMRVRARAWADNRSAELVGMRWVDGVLVENPNARWAITDSTRTLLRSTIEAALGDGASPQELARAIESSYAFSSSRASMIARTEMAMADIAGTLESFRQTKGVVGKQWITAGDDRVSDECLECEAAGTIGLEETFPTGVEAPPNHPNCRCDVVPVFDDEMES